MLTLTFLSRQASQLGSFRRWRYALCFCAFELDGWSCAGDSIAELEVSWACASCKLAEALLGEAVDVVYE